MTTEAPSMASMLADAPGPLTPEFVSALWARAEASDRRDDRITAVEKAVAGIGTTLASVAAVLEGIANSQLRMEQRLEGRDAEDGDLAAARQAGELALSKEALELERIRLQGKAANDSGRLVLIGKVVGGILAIGTAIVAGMQLGGG